MYIHKSFFGGDPEGEKYGTPVPAPMPFKSCDGLVLSDGSVIGE